MELMAGNLYLVHVILSCPGCREVIRYVTIVAAEGAAIGPLDADMISALLGHLR